MSTLTKLIMGSMALATSVTAAYIPSPVHSAAYTDTFDNVTVTSDVLSFQPIVGPTTSGFTLPSVPGVKLHGLVKPSLPNSAGLTLRTSLADGSASVSPSATTYNSLHQILLLDLVLLRLLRRHNGGRCRCNCKLRYRRHCYDIHGNMVGEAAFSFAPGQLFEVPMVKAVLPSTFTGLQSFTIGISGGEFTPALTTLQIDNVAHTNYW